MVGSGNRRMSMHREAQQLVRGSCTALGGVSTCRKAVARGGAADDKKWAAFASRPIAQQRARSRGSPAPDMNLGPGGCFTVGQCLLPQLPCKSNSTLNVEASLPRTPYYPHSARQDLFSANRKSSQTVVR